MLEQLFLFKKIIMCQLNSFYRPIYILYTDFFVFPKFLVFKHLKNLTISLIQFLVLIFFLHMIPRMLFLNVRICESFCICKSELWWGKSLLCFSRRDNSGSRFFCGWHWRSSSTLTVYCIEGSIFMISTHVLPTIR